MNGIVMNTFATVSTAELQGSARLPFQATRIRRVEPPDVVTLELSAQDGQTPRRRQSVTLKRMDKVRSVRCAFCRALIVDGLKQCLELPSQYFHEVLECYYCHNEEYPFQPPSSFAPRDKNLLHDPSSALVRLANCQNLVCLGPVFCLPPIHDPSVLPSR